MTRPEIKYSELTKDSLTPGDVDDLNGLVLQLLKTAPEVTLERMEVILASGTRIFSARVNKHIVATVLLCSEHILAGTKDWIEDVVVDESYRRMGLPADY
ncbi:MAG TPA: GNAT family N-acetyltransferase [Candidatus Saccharimonadia bacterium]|nr:GNAT family N-acetyltransferase [Candidatus Saccharimonadia bacterium]